jgi:hypothetical protein
LLRILSAMVVSSFRSSSEYFRLKGLS